MIAAAVSPALLDSPLLRRALRTGQALAVAGVAAFVLHATTGFGHGADWIFNDVVYNGLLVLASVACLARAALFRTERRAWLLLGLGIASWTAGDLHYAFVIGDAANPPFPSLGDAFYLAFYPTSFAALVLLLRNRMSGHVRSLWIDGATAALAAASAAASVLLELVSSTTGGSLAAVATNLAYPLGDVLLLALVIGVFALTGWRPGHAWTLIGFGMIATTIADGIYLGRVAADTYVEGGLYDVFWPAAMLLMAQAAWRPSGSAMRPVVYEGRRVLVTPAVCALIAVAVQTYDHFERTNLLALILSVATVVAVIVRLDVTFAEKRSLLGRLHEQATTDPVTGLGNRRKLMTDLRALLADAEGSSALLMVFDLDGFKRYNDTFGHPAGDALLARLGSRLATAVEPFGGWAYRLGGDEFCVLAQVDERAASPLIDAAANALADHGDGFAIRSSFGAVFVPSEADDQSEALRLADQRLYAEKARRASSRGLPQDVLLQVLYEREPDLHQHVRRVAQLADATGRRLGLDGEALDELRLAAELHDIGKLAVPDEVLLKPAPLGEQEWAFVRRHTLIGQRILTASPALVAVGRIVRSTHERWDGAGYPDGAAGEEIPLAARIIHACDAYVAITEARPYAGSATPEAARDELRRCAGTQFDPAVVDALCAAAVELAEGAVA